MLHIFNYLICHIQEEQSVLLDAEHLIFHVDGLLQCLGVAASPYLLFCTFRTGQLFCLWSLTFPAAHLMSCFSLLNDATFLIPPYHISVPVECRGSSCWSSVWIPPVREPPTSQPASRFPAPPMTVPGHLHTTAQPVLAAILITVQGLKKAEVAASLERISRALEIIKIRHPGTIKPGSKLCFELNADVSMLNLV